MVSLLSYRLQAAFATDSQLTPLRCRHRCMYCSQRCTTLRHVARRRRPRKIHPRTAKRRLQHKTRPLRARLPCDGDAERSVVALQDIKAGERYYEFR